MGVIMQAFYWDCPRHEDQEKSWWAFIKDKVPSLKKHGFTAIWLPPASKAFQVKSMGYDLYDYYDLGDTDQRGGVETWFGSKRDLLDLVQTIHNNEMHVYADIVFNHNSGGDGIERNPIDGKERWTLFKTKHFPRNMECFHPSVYEQWDNETFEDMPDLCHRNPYVLNELVKYSQWMIEDIGFDGFRYDCVKGYGGWLVRALQELRYKNPRIQNKIFGVGECWATEYRISSWLDETNAFSDNHASAFDFPLRAKLKDLCDSYGFDMRNLSYDGTLLKHRSLHSVPFVENHDMDVHHPDAIKNNRPIYNDKMLAYAYILTHEGYPCVFWADYYKYNLAEENLKSGIAALVKVHEDYAAGNTCVLYADHNLYIMQREGYGLQKGLVLVMNNRGDSWNGNWVKTKWTDMKMIPVAWRGKDDLGYPQTKYTNQNGEVDFWAPPRGYTVYVPTY